MQIIYEEILAFREFPQEYLQVPLKKYDSRYKTLIDPQPFKNTFALQETLKKSTRPHRLTPAEWPIWEITPEPLRQTHCGRVTGSHGALPAHWRPVFFTDAPW